MKTPSRRNSRRAGIRRQARPLSRPLGGERLEGRLMMDASPFHNPIDPTDVNRDWQTTALDAVIVINHLQRQGSGPMAAPAPSAAEGEQSFLVDVDGNGNLTPLDALRVINHLMAPEGTHPFDARFLLQPTVAGQVVTSVDLNQAFTLQVFVQDLRPVGEVPALGGNEALKGIEFAYLDVQFTNASLTATGNITHNVDAPGNRGYGALPAGTINANTGLIDEAGSGRFDLAGAGPHGPNPILLWSVPFTVSAAPQLVAQNDTFTIDENAQSAPLTVLTNDSLRQPSFVGARPTGTGHEVDTAVPPQNLLVTGTVDFGRTDLTVNGFALSLARIVSATNGNASIDNGGTPANPADDVIRFTPTQGFSGDATIVYEVSNGQGGTQQATATVTVGSGRPSITIPGAQQVDEDQTLTFAGNVSVRDTDIGTGNMRVTLTATNGNVTLGSTTGINFSGGANNSATMTFTGTLANVNGALNNMTYRPGSNYNGPATLVIVANDQGNTGPAPQEDTKTVQITVNAINDPPVNTVPGAQAPFLGAPFTFNTAGGNAIRVNDADGNVNLTTTISLNGGGTLSVAATQGVNITNNNSANMQLVGNRDAINAALDGALTFTPPNAPATVTLTINTSDGTVSDQDTVTLNVVPPERPFAVNDFPRAPEGSTNVAISPLTNDICTTQQGSVCSIIAVDQTGIVGTLQQNGNNFTYNPPDAEFNGTTSFRYTIHSDATQGNDGDKVGTVTITITEVNDPVTATNDNPNLTTPEETALQIPGATLTQNDVKGPANENTQNLTVIAAATTRQGALVSVVNNVVTYTPAPNFVGQDTFTYTVQDDGTTDGVAAPTTSIGTVTVNVTEVNDPPVPTHDTITPNGTEDTAVTIALTTLSGNDSPGPASESGQTLTVTAVQAGTGGGVAISGNNAVFTPSTDFNGTATFTYTVRDSGTPNLTATGTVTVTINAVNDAPIAGADTVGVQGNQPIAGIPFQIQAADLLPNDRPGPATATDEANQTLSIVNVNTTQVGATVTVANGVITYTAPAGFEGQATFTYTVQDSGNPAQTAQGTVTVNVINFQTSTIAGHVYIDVNNDQHFTPGVDAPIGGVAITLTGIDFQNQAVNLPPIVTDRDGAYSFANVRPGSYHVIQGATVNLQDGPDFVDVGGVLAGNDEFTFAIDRLGGVTSLENDFTEMGLEPEYQQIYDLLAIHNEDGIVISGNALRQGYSFVGGGWTNYSSPTFDPLTQTLSILRNGQMRTIQLIGNNANPNHNDPRIQYSQNVQTGEFVAYIRGNSARFFTEPEPAAADAFFAQMGQ